MFVDSLVQMQPPDDGELARLRGELPAGAGTQALLGSASELLSAMTHFVGVVSAPSREQFAFRHIDFVPLDAGRVLADINVAILYVFAISSLEVYGVIMGGWASNSKYPFLGSLRSAAQMISYEVSLGLIIIGIIISTGSMNFSNIVAVQDTGWGLFGWYWLPHLPMVALFFISALAETNRPPFDLPEAESELVAGYQVEYSATPFLLFMAGEYIAIFLMCALISLLFFGGWLSPIPGLPDGPLWMVGKMAFFFFMFAMVKAIVPRYRYDQLMRIGWKVFLPLSLAWVVIVAFLAKFEVLGGFWARWAIGG